MSGTMMGTRPAGEAAARRSTQERQSRPRAHRPDGPATKPPSSFQPGRPVTVASTPPRRRRQIGADRRREPLPSVPTRASTRSLAIGRLALLVTVGSWLAYVVTVIVPAAVAGIGSPRAITETLVYAVLVSLLAVSAIAYIVARQGYLRRTRTHVRVPRAELDAFYERSPRSATVLVPSFREEPEVVRQTVLSAALQEFPELRVVLLVDDPPTTDAGAQARLDATRAIPLEVVGMLEAPRSRFATSLAKAEAVLAEGRPLLKSDYERAAADYEHACRWLDELAAGWTRHDHTDDFLADHVLRALAHDLAVTAAAIRGAMAERARLEPSRMVQLHRRLVWTFTAEVSVFERKRYVSLSAEPNKAMNLNSYIGLMGRSFVEQDTASGRLLLPCEADDPEATLHVARPDYLVTLDADSVLLPEYCLRLVQQIEKPGNERVGVVQTPYSAFPGAPTRVERLAGATTDLQHVVHQGMAEHGAAFWVGANAILRMAAVDDLRVEDGTEGHPISRFISDRTVIEDTESTLDLACRGWSVSSYPERLAYSASPPDFGALCVQRQRWANGGLLILSNLREYWRTKKERGERRRLTELLLRANYLGSITWATVGLVLLLAYPFDNRLMSGLVVASALPYFVVMATDLRRCGYKRTDVLRIYGFNLVMLPVNAGGVLRSVGQMATGHKVPFARTPKVRERTVAPALMVLLPYVIVLVSAYAFAHDVHYRHWTHAVFAGANVVLTLPAVIAIIGLRNSIVDVARGVSASLYTNERRTVTRTELDPVADWAAVLYTGSTTRPHLAHRAAMEAVR